MPKTVAARLRGRREELGMSARALARSVGVSPSLISQIENAKANPSVGTLYAIVTALGMSLDELFADNGSVELGAARPPAPGRGGHHVLRQEDRRTLDLASGVHWERLSPTSDSEVDFLQVTYQAGAESCPPDALMRHSGSEYGLVLRGRLGATVGFEHYELEAGDSIVFDSSLPHRFWTIGDEPTTIVWTVIGRVGSRADRIP
jgi:transcriptional regulator with XRE-family HTH domain